MYYIIEVNNLRDYNQETINRIKRAEGQLRGILRLIEEKKDCKDVVTQLSAARSAIDKTIASIVAENLQQCILDANKEGKDTNDAVKEAIKLLTKSK